MAASTASACDDRDDLWVKTSCEKGVTLTPQVKRLGTSIIVYCYGMRIIVDSGHEKQCPPFTFALTMSQSFQVGDFSFDAGTILVKG